MSFYRLESNLQRSKSTGALDAIDSDYIDSKVVSFFANYCSNQCSNNHHDSSPGFEKLLDSLNKSHRQIVDLKQKNQKLRGVVEQQQTLLKLIKEDPKITYKHTIADFLKDSMIIINECDSFEGKDYEKPKNKQARILLDAIAPKRSQADVNVLRDALAKFENEFRQIGKYNPYLTDVKEIQNQHKADSEKTQLLESLRPPDVAWESSKRTLCDRFDPPRKWWNLEKIDVLPLKRKDVFEPGKPECDPLSLETEYLYAEEQKMPPSPLQPADPGVSVIDHLMQSAVINKKIAEGDLNGSFEEALSHCNLALVMCACRAVNPSEVFNPCCLSQSVLLSLVQQLATDMVHETQLKCRYLEEALINLDVSDQVTRAYLPLVVGEVRKHLTKFVRIYPHHVANRRLSLIIMAADNLIK